jgi:hypothetical protein
MIGIFQWRIMPGNIQGIIADYRQLSFNNIDEEYSTLLEDAEKLYKKLVKERTEQVLNEYSIKNGSTHNKSLSPDEELQQHYEPSIGLSLPPAISDNQAVHVRGVNRVFVRTEF